MLLADCSASSIPITGFGASGIQAKALQLPSNHAGSAPITTRCYLRGLKFKPEFPALHRQQRT